MLLVVFCGALGFIVYSNVSAATNELLDKQISNTLRIVESEILQAQNTYNSLRDADYQDIVEGLGVADGGVFIVNEKGIVIADTRQVITGKSVASYDWYIEARKTLTSEFYATYGQAEVYAHSVVLDGNLVVSFLSSEAIDELLQTPLYVIGVMGLICVTLMGIIMYFLITRLLINPVESLEEQSAGLSSGKQIDLKPLKGCPEILSTAKLLNELVEKQKSRAQGRHSSLSKGPSAEKDSATSFELADMLRAIFEQYRETVTAQKLNFSLLVDRDVPQTILADRKALEAKLVSLLNEVFLETRPSTKVEIVLSLSKFEQITDDGALTIVVHVHYNEQEKQILLEVKRG